MVYNITLLVGNGSLVYEVSVRSKTCKEIFQPVKLFTSSKTWQSVIFRFLGLFLPFVPLDSKLFKDFIGDPMLY